MSNRPLVVRNIDSRKADARNFAWPDCDFKYIDAIYQDQELRHMHKISAVYQGDFVRDAADVRITIEYNSGYHDELISIDSLIASKPLGGEGEEFHTYQDICNVQANINKNANKSTLANKNDPVNENKHENKNSPEGTKNYNSYSNMSYNVSDNIDVICFKDRKSVV